MQTYFGKVNFCDNLRFLLSNCNIYEPQSIMEKPMEVY